MISIDYIDCNQWLIFIDWYRRREHGRPFKFNCLLQKAYFNKPLKRFPKKINLCF